MDHSSLFRDSNARTETNTTLRKSLKQFTNSLPKTKLFSRGASLSPVPSRKQVVKVADLGCNGQHEWAAFRQEELMEHDTRCHDRDIGHGKGSGQFAKCNSFADARTLSREVNNGYGRSRSPMARPSSSRSPMARSPSNRSLARPSSTSCFLVIGDPVNGRLSSVDLASSDGPIVIQLHQTTARSSNSISSPFKVKGSPGSGPKPLENLITMQRRPTVNGLKCSSPKRERAVVGQNSDFFPKSKSTNALANSQAQGIPPMEEAMHRRFNTRGLQTSSPMRKSTTTGSFSAPRVQLDHSERSERRGTSNYVPGYNCQEGSSSDNFNYTWTIDGKSDNQSRCNANMFFKSKTSHDQRQPRLREERIARHTSVDVGKKLASLNTMPEKKKAPPVELRKRDTLAATSFKPSQKSWAERLQEETAKGNGMKIKDLKQKLSLMGVSTESFTEKSELVQAYADGLIKAEKEAAVTAQREPQPYSWAPPTTVPASNSSPPSDPQKSVVSVGEVDNTSSHRGSAHGSQHKKIFSDGSISRSSHSNETYSNSNKSYPDDLRSISPHSPKRQVVDVGELPRRPSGLRIPEVLALIAASSEKGKSDKSRLPAKSVALENGKNPSQYDVSQASHKMREISNQLSYHPVSSKILEIAKILDEVVVETHAIDLSSEGGEEELRKGNAYKNCMTTQIYHHSQDHN